MKDIQVIKDVREVFERKRAMAKEAQRRNEPLNNNVLGELKEEVMSVLLAASYEDRDFPVCGGDDRDPRSMV
jgi:hypothetical protein